MRTQLSLPSLHLRLRIPILALPLFLSFFWLQLCLPIVGPQNNVPQTKRYRAGSHGSGCVMSCLQQTHTLLISVVSTVCYVLTITQKNTCMH